MLYIVQFHKEQHTGAQCESPKCLSYGVMEKHDTLHKINDFIHKDIEYKEYNFLGRLWRQSQYISAMSETQGCGLKANSHRTDKSQQTPTN